MTPEQRQGVVTDLTQRQKEIDSLENRVKESEASAKAANEEVSRLTEQSERDPEKAAVADGRIDSAKHRAAQAEKDAKQAGEEAVGLRDYTIGEGDTAVKVRVDAATVRFVEALVESITERDAARSEIEGMTPESRQRAAE